MNIKEPAFLQDLYNNDKAIFEKFTLEEIVNSKYLDTINSFHARDIFIHKEDDEVFCGIRSSVFCIEFGYSELFENMKEKYHNEENYNDNINRDDNLVLITANNKGNRVMTLIEIPNENNW